jgi:hypothetical protein
MKRIFFSPMRKRLVDRKATEMLSRIVIYNIRQLVYLKYTKGIDLSIVGEMREPTLSDLFNA